MYYSKNTIPDNGCMCNQNKLITPIRKIGVSYGRRSGGYQMENFSPLVNIEEPTNYNYETPKIDYSEPSPFTDYGNTTFPQGISPDNPKYQEAIKKFYEILGYPSFTPPSIGYDYSETFQKIPIDYNSYSQLPKSYAENFTPLHPT